MLSSTKIFTLFYLKMKCDPYILLADNNMFLWLGQLFPEKPKHRPRLENTVLDSFTNVWKYKNKSDYIYGYKIWLPFP